MLSYYILYGIITHSGLFGPTEVNLPTPLILTSRAQCEKVLNKNNESFRKNGFDPQLKCELVEVVSDPVLLKAGSGK